MTTLSRFSISLLAFFLSSFLLYQNISGQETYSKIDSILVLLSKDQMFSGQVLLMEKGKILMNRSYGESSLKPGLTVVNSTPLDIASVSKTFTAVAIMILYEKGLLQLDDKLINYYPELPYKDVTIRQILSHTSGLPNVMGLIFKEFEHTKHFSNNDIVNLLVKYRPDLAFKPGSNFEYGNLGYELLAGIIEKASGQSYVTFLREHILNPIGMSNTFHFSENPDVQKLYGEVTIDNFHLMTKGASNIYSTTEDLYKWDAALRTEQVLNKRTIDNMYKQPQLDEFNKGQWGLGWNIIDPDTSNLIVQHMGEGINTTSVLTRYITKDKAVIYLHTGPTTYAYEIYMLVKNIWEGKPYQIPEKRIVYGIDPSLLQLYAGDYGENGFMHLTLDNGRFYMQADGAPSRVKLIPMSDTTFYFEDQHMKWQIYRQKGEIIGFGPLGQKQHIMLRQSNKN